MQHGAAQHTMHRSQQLHFAITAAAQCTTCLQGQPVHRRSGAQNRSQVARTADAVRARPPRSHPGLHEAGEVGQFPAGRWYRGVQRLVVVDGAADVLQCVLEDVLRRGGDMVQVGGIWQPPP